MAVVTMPTAEQVVQLALAQTGDRYVLGAEASPTNPDPSRFDCSELVEWVCARLGVKPTMPDLVVNQAAHCRRQGTAITVETAVRTRGALLIRDYGWSGSGGEGNHVAISLGDGTTIEARGSKWGVGSWSAYNRGWNMGALIPGVDYSRHDPDGRDDNMPATDATVTTDGNGCGWTVIPVPFPQARSVEALVPAPTNPVLPGYWQPVARLFDAGNVGITVTGWFPSSTITVRLTYAES
jgi:cell wall-associated NlpC family hydrolase